MSTPHNAANRGDIAKTVLMPGDPLRAKFIAENYLTEVTCYNTIRNMLGFTGLYRGKRVSVQGSGMGIPSIGIYSYELFSEYDVQSIIRIGTAGGLAEKVGLRDLVAGMGACTNSAFAAQYRLPGTFAPIASWRLLKKADEAARSLGVELKVGNLLSSDTFYSDDPEHDKWISMGVLAVEMEAAGLYCTAAHAGREALCLCSISDLPATGESLSPLERQESFHDMMRVALELAD
ncbi:MAG: purine-nucleoside phosphorylase [Oscillospiraceae bacterium]|nr:MAG: purine-nucleoside phosphorylase [Oscillospiraceae bacterium]